MKFEEKLKKYRAIFQLSQEQLAERIFVSRQVVTKWENAGGLPDLKNLKRIAELFGVSIDYLLDDEQDIITPVLREKIILEKNTYNHRYDYAVARLKNCYSNDTIYGLTELGKDKGKAFNILDFLSLRVISFGDWVAEQAIWFLIEKSTQNLIVKVTKEYMEIRELSSVLDTSKFTFEDTRLMRLEKLN